MKNQKNVNRKKRSVGTWISNLVFGIFAALLAASLLLNIMLYRAGDDTVSSIPFRLLEVTSDSMYPKFRAGDGVLIFDEKFEELQVGDIVTFYDTGVFITHEIIEKNEDGSITTKGLRNTLADAPFYQDQYEGKVIGVIPGLAFFLSFTKTTAGKGICVCIIVMLCFGTRILSVVYDALSKANAAKTKKKK